MRKFLYITIAITFFLNISCSHQQKQQEQQDQQNDPANPNGLPGFGHTNTAGWKIGSYVDEFGDKTENNYLVNKFNGEISSIHTGYVPLTVKCIIDSSKVDFSLYEYGKYSFNELYSFELNIKDPKGRIHQFRQFHFHDDMKDSIIKVLSMEGNLKASVRFNENSRGRLGKFIIEGTSHLPNMLNELENKD